MSSAAGPSKKTKTPKKSAKEASPVPVSASVVSDSDSESGDSDNLDDSEEPEERPVQTPKRAAKGSQLRYQPPPGMEALSASVSFKTSPLEFDALAAKRGVELWAIRVPADLKVSRLSGLTVSKVKTDSVRGSLSTKSGSYVLEGAGGASGAPGAEMEGLSLMVPSLARGGKLFRAPVAVSRRLLLTPVEAAAAAADESEGFVAPAKRKREQPAHLLKFRNAVSGFHTPGHTATVVAGDAAESDVEMEEQQAEAPAAEVKEDAEEESPRKAKKSKSEGKEKKSKKSKDKDSTDSPAKEKKSKKSKD